MYTKFLVPLTMAMRAGGVAPVPETAPVARVIDQSVRATMDRGAAASGRVDVRELLTAARGVPAPVCALASDGAGNWGGGWDAPDVAVRDSVHQLVRDLRADALSSDESHALITAIGSDDACVRHLAGTLIGRSGDKAFVPDLVDKLRSSAEFERAGAARALGLLGDRTAAADVARVLHDGAAGVRANAAWAIGRIGDDRYSSDLASLTRDASAEVRAAAVTSLGQVHSQDNVDVLLKVLRDDSSDEVRRTAAWALGQLGSRTASQGLANAMRGDKSPRVREMSAWALGELHARDFADALTSTLKSDDDSSVREMAAWALGELGEHKAADALADAAAKDKSAKVRGTAAWAVGELNPGRAPKQLVDALHDSDDDVRLKAAWALSQIHDASVVNDVTAALKVEKVDRVRQALVRALLESGDASTETFQTLLESKDKDTREMAVRALAGRRGPWPWPWPQPRPRPFP